MPLPTHRVCVARLELQRGNRQIQRQNWQTDRLRDGQKCKLTDGQTDKLTNSCWCATQTMIGICCYRYCCCRCCCLRYCCRHFKVFTLTEIARTPPPSDGAAWKSISNNFPFAMIHSKQGRGVGGCRRWQNGTGGDLNNSCSRRAHWQLKFN